MDHSTEHKASDRANRPTRSFKTVDGLPSNLRQLEDPFDFPLTVGPVGDPGIAVDKTDPVWADVAEMADVVEPFILGDDAALDRPQPNPYTVHAIPRMVWAERCGAPLVMTQPSADHLNHQLIWVQSYQCQRAGPGRVLLPKWAEALPALAPEGVTWDVRTSIPGPLMDMVALCQNYSEELERVATLPAAKQPAALQALRGEFLVDEWV